MADDDKWEKGKRTPVFNRAASPKPNDEKTRPDEEDIRKPPKFINPQNKPRGPGWTTAVKRTARRTSIHHAAQKEAKKLEENQRDMLKSQFNDKEIDD